MSNLVVQEVSFVEQKDLRERYVERIEVLDKVKTLFLIPGIEAATTQMLADYFEVNVDTIRRIYQQNVNEVNRDGVVRKKAGEIRNVLTEYHVRLRSFRGRAVFTLGNEVEFNVPNSGTKIFPKRAILRIAMLLHNSEVAKEIRTQLLIIFEHSAIEHKAVEIDNEHDLLLNLAKSYVAKDFEAFAIANQNYIDYQNKYINQIENDKKLLDEEILKWQNKVNLVNAIRILSGQSQKSI